MPGFILHQGAIVQCAHAGQAQPTSMSTQVTVGGMPVVLQPFPHTISVCPFNVSGSPSPCVTATWTTATTRVTSNGMPVLLFDSQATCAPNGTPVIIASSQTRVKAI